VNKLPTELGPVVIRLNCVGVTEVAFFGEVSPKILNNGTELEFDPGAGELESEVIRGATLSGNFKVEGL
jgi:hypothetical protein